MVNFAEMNKSNKEQEKKQVVKKANKNTKGKKVSVATQEETHIDMGVYGRFNASNIELMSGSKFRVFKSGNVGLTNARFKVKIGDEWLVFGPCNASFLKERDDSWREENDSPNTRSGLKVWELDGYEVVDGESNIQSILGEKKVKE